MDGQLLGPGRDPARMSGQLPPLASNEEMKPWARWGRKVLQEGDIVFRLGDARALRGVFPLSQFIARATGSPFSHTGIIAVEDGAPVVYDCSSAGVQRQPFEVWMLDCVGAMGVKRLKPEYRRHIPGVIGYCRAKFEEQVPFDYGFSLDDSALYCLELTENAFRSQGVVLSEPVKIGDWEHLTRYPLTAFAIPYGSGLVLERPITLDQPVYLPGNDRQGVWGSPMLETVLGPKPKRDRAAVPPPDSPVSLRGDLELVVFAAGELGRSYEELPARWFLELVRRPRARERLLVNRGPARESAIGH